MTEVNFCTLLSLSCYFNRKIYFNRDHECGLPCLSAEDFTSRGLSIILLLLLLFFLALPLLPLLLPILLLLLLVVHLAVFFVLGCSSFDGSGTWFRFWWRHHL